MSRTGAGLPAVAAFTLVVPMLATPAAAAPVDAPLLPVQPPQYLPPPEPPEPWLAAGITYAPSAAEPGYDLYTFTANDQGTLDQATAPLVARSYTDDDDIELPLSSVELTFSPDGSQAVFSGELAPTDPAEAPAWTLMIGDVGPASEDPELTDVHPLAYPLADGAADYQPAWSPDGRYLAFVREYSSADEARAGEGPRVQILDLSTGTVSEVPLPDGPDVSQPDSRWSLSPTWSPDSTGLLMVANPGVADSGSFAAIDPDISSSGTLWYYDLVGQSVHQLTVSDPACDDAALVCDGTIGAEDVAWSPTEATTAVYSPDDGDDGGGVGLLTLPTDLPGPAGSDLVIDQAPVQIVDDGDPPPPTVRSLAWDPDGSAVYGISGEFDDSQILRITPQGETSSVFQTDAYVTYHGLAYQPYSDLGITVDVPGSVPIGTSFTVTAEVTNAGPSPSRPGQVQIEVGYDQSVPAAPPAGCVVNGADLLCTLEVEGLQAGSSTQVQVTVPTGDDPETPRITGVVTSGSPEKNGSTDDNRTTTVLVTLDDPALTTDARTQRISFTMDRLHEGAGSSPDLVQSFTAPSGGTVEESYRVLAADQADEITTPEGEVVPGPFQIAEDTIDYSPDGSQAVFTAAYPGDYAPYSRRLLLADVVGTQQGDLGQPGTLTGVGPLLPADQAPADDARYDDVQPVWSPDGGTVAFVRELRDDTGTTTQLLTYDIAAGTVSSPIDTGWLTDNPQQVSRPTWSADGTALVYLARPAGSDSTATLWLLPLSTGIPHELTLPEDASICWPESDLCTGALTADDVAWAPDGSAVAFTSPDQDSSVVYLLTLAPDAVAQAAGLPAGDALPVTGLRTLAYYQGSDGAGTRLLNPTWSPDSSQVAVIPQREGADPEVRAADVATGQTSVLFTSYSRAWLAEPEYDPYSDLSLTVAAPTTTHTGVSTTVSLTVVNDGPSPARDAHLTLELPDGLTPGTLPDECTLAGTTLTCDLTGPLPAGEPQLLTLPVTPTGDGSYDLTATMVTNSVDPEAVNDQASATLRSITPVSERIVFAMERPGDPGVDALEDTSLDLVRSFTTEPGDPTASDYTVLAAETYPSLTSPGGDVSDWAYLPDEDNIDYTADGSRAVFERTARTAEWSETSGGVSVEADSHLVIADVVGTQQDALGAPGELINATEVTNTRPVLTESYRDTDPAWSPEDDRIAFVRSYRDGDAVFGSELLVLDVATGEITSPFQADWFSADGGQLAGMSTPTWSPDGQAIIFAARLGDQNQESLWYLPLSTGIPHQLTLPEDGSVCWPIFDTTVCQGPVWGWQPAWAPDGGQVAFAYYTAIGPVVSVLTVDETTTEAALGTDWTTPAPIAGLTGMPVFNDDDLGYPPVTEPTWSPDGQRIAVLQGNSDFPNAILVAGLTSTEASTMYAVPEVGTALAHPEFEPLSDLTVTIGAPTGPVTTTTATPVTVTISNNGPSPARDAIVVLTLPEGAQPGTLPTGCTAAGTVLTCTLADRIDRGAATEVTVPVTFPTAGEHLVTVTVSTNSIDTEAGNDSAERTFTATTTPTEPTTAPDLQVQLTTDADRAWLGGDGLPAHITVTNGGDGPAPDVQLTTALPAGVLVLDAGTCPVTGPCDLGALASGDQVSVDVLLQPTAVGQIEMTASASTTATDPVPGNNSATAGFEAVQAQLRLLPSVAEPGEVTLLYGVDLPPDAEITLRWSEGITAVYRPVAAEEDGTLRTSVLIVDGDELGRRTLQVTSVAGTAFGLAVPPTLLVVPRSMEPPDFLGRS